MDMPLKVCRFIRSAQGEAEYGLVGDGRVSALGVADLTSLVSALETGVDHHELAWLPLSDVTLISPVVPSKIIVVGLNYEEHARELSKPLPVGLRVFLKPPTAIIGMNEPIEIPRIRGINVFHEGELGVVIAKTASQVSCERAYEFVLGYTCVNDVTARRQDGCSSCLPYGKIYDSFCPCGPYIAIVPDAANRRLTVRVNGEVRQQANTSAMRTKVNELVAQLSDVMTLLPGDLLLSGTPAGSAPLRPGDTCEVDIEGVGQLRNPVIQRRSVVCNDGSGV